MTRAVQTAHIISKALGVPVRQYDDLRELSAGELEGRSDADAFETLNAALDSWSMGELRLRIGRLGDWGEDVVARLSEVTKRITEDHLGETVVVVSHGGLLQVGLPWICSNLEPAYGLRRHINNSAVIDVESITQTRCIAWEDTELCVETMPLLRGFS